VPSWIQIFNASMEKKRIKIHFTVVLVWDVGVQGCVFSSCLLLNCHNSCWLKDYFSMSCWITAPTPGVRSRTLWQEIVQSCIFHLQGFWATVHGVKDACRVTLGLDFCPVNLTAVINRVNFGVLKGNNETSCLDKLLSFPLADGGENFPLV